MDLPGSVPGETITFGGQEVEGTYLEDRGIHQWYTEFDDVLYVLEFHTSGTEYFDDLRAIAESIRWVSFFDVETELTEPQPGPLWSRCPLPYLGPEWEEAGTTVLNARTPQGWYKGMDMGNRQAWQKEGSYTQVWVEPTYGHRADLITDLTPTTFTYEAVDPLYIEGIGEAPGKSVHRDGEVKAHVHAFAYKGVCYEVVFRTEGAPEEDLAAFHSIISSHTP